MLMVKKHDAYNLFEAVIWCLTKYFGHTDYSAIQNLNSYYENNNNKIDDDFYYYERPFRIAMRIQYREVLKLGNDNTLKFYDWVKESGYNKTPQEALVYFRKNNL